MTRPSGYTGPTSGRITIGATDADGNRAVSRESFYDRPLTADEAQATEEFRALSPNEQVREYRVQKWNADARLKELEVLRAAPRRDDAEISRLRARLATYAPDGYRAPKAAADLIEHAKANGWKVAWGWSVSRDNPDDPEDKDPGGARLSIIVGRDLYQFKLAWCCDPGGAGRMAPGGLARGPRRGWHDAPSVKRIKEIITEVPDAE